MPGIRKRLHWPPTTLIILAFLAVLGIIIFAARPQQAPVTDQVLDLKSHSQDEYLDFIADNLITGGPPKDGIPAIDEPKYLTVGEAGLSDDEQVFGVDYGGKLLAFPQDIMYWHEIVNENTLSGEEFSVTYCPLTGSVIGYKDHNLGVSGALYNSNLVMYNRATDSHYPQILGKGVDGPDKGRLLETFPVTVTTWKQWRDAHPDTLVLSRDTGHERDYDRNPYPGYDAALRVWFPVAAEDDRFHKKQIVHGVIHDGVALTVLKEPLKESGSLTYEGLVFTYNEALDSVEVSDDVTHFDVYWFAWYAYHPDTIVVNG